MDQSYSDLIIFIEKQRSACFYFCCGLFWRLISTNLHEMFPHPLPKKVANYVL